MLTSIWLGSTALSSNVFTIWCRILISRPPRVFRRFKRRSCSLLLPTPTVLVLLICIETADQIELKFGGWHYYGTPRPWLAFSYAALNSRLILAPGFSSNTCAFADQLLILLSLNLVSKLIFGTPQALLTLCYILLNSCRSLD